MVVEKTPLLGITKWTDPEYQDPVHVSQFNDDADALEAFAGRGGLHFDVRAFGAVGDGITDDTAAVQAAIDAADPGDTIHFPPVSTGVDSLGYLVGNLTVDKPLTLAGGDAMFGSRLLAAPGTSGFLLTIAADAISDYQHLFGVAVRGLYFDGNGRTVDCGGIDMQFVDRFTFEDVQVRHFRHTGLRLNESCREYQFRNVYVRFCGTGRDHPAVDLSESSTSDGPNNVYLFGLQVVYSFGTSIRIRPTDFSSTTRNIYLFGAMLHGVNAGSATVTKGNGYAGTYSIAGHEVTHALLDVADVRQLYLIGCRLHTPGKGLPHVLVQDRPGGGGANDVILSSCNIGPASSWTAEFTGNVSGCTSTAHRLPTGARVRLTTTGTLPAGLTAGTDLFVITDDADTFRLAATRADAEAGTAIDITDAGTGTHTITAQESQVDVAAGRVRLTAGTELAGTTNRAHVLLAGAGEVYSDLTVRCASTPVEGGGTLLNARTPMTFAEGVNLPNAVPIRMKDAGGTDIEVAKMSGDTLALMGGLVTIAAAGYLRGYGGSLGIPGLSFVGDTNTGVYSPGADRIALAAGASQVMEGRLQSGVMRLGFFGSTPTARPSGVAVDAASIHAALVALGLIAP